MKNNEATIYYRAPFRNIILHCVHFALKKGWDLISYLIGALFLEPAHVLKASFLMPLGWVTPFKYYSINPHEITFEQSKKSPVLLLHGSYHNQSAWLPLAKELQKADLGRPLYTVNLRKGPSGTITESDLLILDAKIEEIKAQYNEHGIVDVKIDIIGHSRGGNLAGFIYAGLTNESDKNRKTRRAFIGKIIRLGPTVPHQEKPYDNVFEIIGTHDFLTPKLSSIQEQRRLVLPCGHLELLYSPCAHKQIIQWLS